MVAKMKTISWLCVSFFSTVGYCQDINSQQQVGRTIQVPKSVKTNGQDSSSPRMFSVSHADEHQESSAVSVAIEAFTPIEATSYTDPNYHDNVIKSERQQQLLDAAPVVPSASNLSKEERLLIYTNERNNYPVGSFEYNALQGKIDHLNANE